MPRVLLIEDEEMLGSLVKEGLEASHYEVVWETDGRAGLERARDGGFSLLVLDLMLPGLSGWEVCQAVRRRRDTTPILMLTARDGVDDRVNGLEMGADDYLTKPFETIELLARIEALLRRAPSGAAGVSLERYQFGDINVDVRRAEVTAKGQPLELSAKEFQLLKYFIEHRGATVSRDELLHEVWGYNATPSTRTVDVHVAWLRQKLEPNPRVPQYILTVHGMGYKFAG
jgi:two-component system, OmpR family, alkaline phosphatase synthesis response regulator PhoP